MSNLLPKISIITPTLNVEKDIESCILNVVNQTYKNKEHFIIDGKSTDNTISIVKKYAEKYPHINWVSEEDGGIYEAMNKGIDVANGEWIYFLGSDDMFINEDVLNSIFAQKNTEGLDISYGNVKFKHSGHVYDGEFNPVKLIKKNICHQSIFFRKSVFNKLGKFETKYKGVADWVFNMQWFNEKKLKIKYINDIVAIYNEAGYSFNNPDIEFAADREMLINKYFSAEDILASRNKDK